MSNWDSESGFTLMELSLALAVSTAFLTAFFVAYQTFGRSLTLAADSVSGPEEVADAMRAMTYDLDQATSFISSNSTTIDFETANNGRIAYQLVSNPSNFNDCYLLRYTGGAGTSPSPVGGNGSTPAFIGPRRMIANLNPYSSTMMDFNNHLVATVSLFDNLTASPPFIEMELVVQPESDAPVQYVRAAATPRAYR